MEPCLFACCKTPQVDPTNHSSVNFYGYILYYLFFFLPLFCMPLITVEIPHTYRISLFVWFCDSGTAKLHFLRTFLRYFTFLSYSHTVSQKTSRVVGITLCSWREERPEMEDNFSALNAWRSHETFESSVDSACTHLLRARQ